MSQPDNYEAVSRYNLDPDDLARLLAEQTECVFNWTTQEGYPMGVIMNFLWHDDRAWLTAGAHRHRIAALKRSPKTALVITSKGTSLGPSKSLTIKGRCVFHEDRATKDWFYPAFARKLRGDETAAAAFQQMLDSPIRLIIEVVPEKLITFDGLKMFAHAAGTIDESRLGEALESDTVRLEAELKKRNLT